MRPSGRLFPLQPHFGVNRIAYWAPSSGTTINAIGMPRTGVGTASTPDARHHQPLHLHAPLADDQRGHRGCGGRGTLGGLGLLARQCRGAGRLHLCEPAVADHAAAHRHGVLRADGLDRGAGHDAALSAVVNAIGIGFQRGTHANWQIVHNSGSGAPTLINLGASFPVDSATNVLTLFLYAAPNAASVWVRVVEEVSGAIAEVEITANLPAATQLLSPRNYMNTGSTAAAVAYDCSGVYVETDY
jgi:hypothetical protein